MISNENAVRSWKKGVEGIYKAVITLNMWILSAPLSKKIHRKNEIYKGQEENIKS